VPCLFSTSFFLSILRLFPQSPYFSFTSWLGTAKEEPLASQEREETLEQKWKMRESTTSQLVNPLGRQENITPKASSVPPAVGSPFFSYLIRSKVC
jgi:hypothetical protein